METKRKVNYDLSCATGKNEVKFRVEITESLPDQGIKDALKDVIKYLESNLNPDDIRRFTHKPSPDHKFFFYKEVAEELSKASEVMLDPSTQTKSVLSPHIIKAALACLHMCLNVESHD